MRQDRRFQPGEAVTSQIFARFVSSRFDWLVTVDPHLHRIRSLEEIYTIPTRVVHAAPLLAEWVASNVSRPLLVGPDQESEQWVAEVARRAGAPHVSSPRLAAAIATWRSRLPTWKRTAIERPSSWTTSSRRLERSPRWRASSPRLDSRRRSASPFTVSSPTTRGVLSKTRE
jgi:hypothetical protein